MTAPDKNPLAGVDWASLLKPEFTKDYWVDLQRFVSEERSRFAVYPPPEQVLASLRLTQHAETKVVILGQDPYVDPGQAHGLAFSVPCGMPKPYRSGTSTMRCKEIWASRPPTMDASERGHAEACCYSTTH